MVHSVVLCSLVLRVPLLMPIVTLQVAVVLRRSGCGSRCAVFTAGAVLLRFVVLLQPVVLFIVMLLVAVVLRIRGCRNRCAALRRAVHRPTNGACPCCSSPRRW